MDKYISSFKKRHSGRLSWSTCMASDEKDAMDKLQEQGWSPGNRHKHNGYRLYGGPMKIK
jgi:hypothetical protein